jgi:rSAM/selenodomain-associated transferase 1
MYALGVMARAPSAPGKTRLAAHLSPDRLHALRAALLADTLLVATATPGVDPVVFITPEGSDAEVFAAAPRPVPVVAQRGADLGERMRHALRHLIDERGYEGAMLIGTDVPLLTADHLIEATRLLRTRGGVVVGPADDGGYYLVGMTSVDDRFFTGIAWGSDSVLDETMRRADALLVDLCLVRGAYDVDTIDDLRRLERDLAVEPAEIAPHVRGWLAGKRPLPFF